MYSLNVPVPSPVAALAGRLAREWPGATPRERGGHTLVVKRLGDGDRAAFRRLSARARDVLDGQRPFTARVAAVDWFEDPATGPDPVVYLAVGSPGLEALHDSLCEHFDPVEGLEAEDYVPHVTVARGGPRDGARRLLEREVDPIEWTVDELVLHDADRDEAAGRITLPA